jgi:hypothetical protein
LNAKIALVRRSRTALLFFAAATTLLIACSSGKKNAASPAKASPTPALSAQQLVDQAVVTTEALKSFHFTLTHENGSSPIANGISMKRADGDFLKPDRFRATVDGTLAAGFAVSVQVVNVGDNVWIALVKDKYIPLQNGIGASAILDPNNGVIKAIKGVKNPTIVGNEKINAVDTTIVSGTVDAGDLTSIATQAQAGKPAKGKVWIGNQDHRVYRLRIDGPLNDQEAPNIARQIDFSQFNESLDIQPPQ